MSIKNAILKTGCTFTVNGGTDVTFVPTGQTIPNGIQICVPADEFAVRRTATFKVKYSTRDPKTGVMSKDRKTATYVRPKVLADGSTVFELLRIEREVHPTTSAADAAALLTEGVQLAFDSDFANYWAVGSME